MCRVPARRAVVGPRRDFGDLLVAQRRIVLKFLDADVLLDVPGRHDASVRSYAGALFDRARIGADVFVGHQ